MTGIIFSKSARYDPVSLGDDTSTHSQLSKNHDLEDLPFTPNPKRKWKRIFLGGIISAVLGCLAIIGAVDTFHRVRSITPEKPHIQSPCYCGHSSAEARSLNCEYVPMASAWLPPHCRDTYLETEFDKLGPNPDSTWTYYADYARTTPIAIATISEFAGSTTRFYNEWQWHVMHCMFYWRKLHRAQFSGVVIEPRFNTDAHIGHCTRLILSLNTTSTTVSGVGLGSDKWTREEVEDPADWGDVRDGYGGSPPRGYLNDMVMNT
jgi:hypothetical protein